MRTVILMLVSAAVFGQAAPNETMVEVRDRRACALLEWALPYLVPPGICKPLVMVSTRFAGAVKFDITVRTTQRVRTQTVDAQGSQATAFFMTAEGEEYRGYTIVAYGEIGRAETADAADKR